MDTLVQDFDSKGDSTSTALVANDAGQRLRLVREGQMGGPRRSRAWLAARSGVSAKTIQRYEEGEVATLDTMAKLAAALGVNASWLSFNEGVAPHGSEEMPPVPHESTDLPVTVDAEDTVWVERYAAEPTAGHGGALDDRRTGRYPIAADVARELGHPRVQLGAVRVRGDSMAPTLSDGDFVIVARDPTAVEDICVLEVGGELLVKRVHRDMTTGGLIVVSDNKAYPPQPIGPDAHVRIIGRVVKEDRVRRR